MTARRVGLALILAIAFTALGQQQVVVIPEWYTRASRTWLPGAGVILATPADVDAMRKSGGQIEPGRDYITAVRASLDSDPAASDRCALLLATGDPASQQRRTTYAQSLWIAEFQACKSHMPPQERIDEARRILSPPPLSRRTEISMQTRDPELERYFPAYGIYNPPPSAADAWLSTDPPGRDYKTDVRAAFDRNPIVAAHVCTSAEHQPTAADARQQQLHRMLLDVCGAFPLSKIEAAFAAQKGTDARAALTGLMNATLDQIASMSANARQHEAQAILDRLERTYGQQRFEQALRALALAPDDVRTMAAMIKSRTFTEHSAEVMSWLGGYLQSHSADLHWKRAWRNYLALNGEVARARDVARQVAAASGTNARDKLILAVLDRASGDRPAYDRMLANCPAPDALYLETHGKPARPVTYCEDVVAEFTNAVRTQLAGNTAAAPFSEMFVETNRVAPQSVAIAQSGVPTPPPLHPDVEAEFSAAVRTAEAHVAGMTRLQRDEERRRIEPPIDNGRSLPINQTLVLIFDVPWHEVGAAAIIRDARNLTQPQTLLNLARNLYETRAAKGPDADDWKRGLRAFLFYTGEYDRARALSRELVKQTSYFQHERDVMYEAMIEYLYGNRAPLDRAIATCPPTPKEEQERYGVAAMKPGDDCWSIIVWTAWRAYIATADKVHAGIPALLTEVVHHSTEASIQVFALDALSYLDEPSTERELHALLQQNRLDVNSRIGALRTLARLAENANHWNDAWSAVTELTKLEYAIPTFLPGLWDVIANKPHEMFNVNTQSDLQLRIEIAVKSKNWAGARESIEDLIAADPYLPIAGVVRHWLILLAEAEARSGERVEPLRILGYVARQPLDDILQQMLTAARKQLPADMEPKREETPWNSIRRAPSRPPEPNKTIKT